MWTSQLIPEQGEGFYVTYIWSQLLQFDKDAASNTHIYTHSVW